MADVLDSGQEGAEQLQDSEPASPGQVGQAQSS